MRPCLYPPERSKKGVGFIPAGGLVPRGMGFIKKENGDDKSGSNHAGCATLCSGDLQKKA